MNNEQPPQILYYVTIEFEDGRIESPHYFVFDALAEGVITVREHYRELRKEPMRIVMKELLFSQICTMPEDTHVLVPLTDNGIEDDFRDPDMQQEMVEKAEACGTDGALMGILPYEQEIDDLLCRAFFMGPFVQAQDKQDYIDRLLKDPFETSQPLDYVWLYRPTGEWKEVAPGERQDKLPN